VTAVRTANAIDTVCRLFEEVAECVQEGVANHVVIERDADAKGSVENHEDHAKIGIAGGT
jgi:soluble P-type ATPase